MSIIWIIPSEKCIFAVLNLNNNTICWFGNYNIGREGALLTLPLYMGFLLDFESDENVQLEDLDIEEANRIATEFLQGSE